MSVSVEYSIKEISQIILENTLKMLVNRNVITGYGDILKQNEEDFITKGIIEFKDKNNQKISIHLFTGKIPSIVQNSPLNEYLRANLDVHKILILKERTKKVAKQVMEYPNAEFFFEDEMMEDIASKLFIPKHILLSEDDKNELLKIFKDSELAKINDMDRMSRYYMAKPGDVFKIIRPSITAGNNIFYRRVVMGNLTQLFDN
jgi:DNA-directed RNA polymerase subunit H (RpoH/RPB5)